VLAAGADIFRIPGPDDREKSGAPMRPSHLNARQDIEPCRTAALGGNSSSCEPCQEHHSRSRSGTKRHGPQGQPDQAQEWLPTHKAWLLPVPHVMVTFPRPDARRRLARRQQPSRYKIRFRRSAAALQALASAPRCMGGNLGRVGVLHTWTRDRPSPPHGHDLVPGGGWSAEGQDWLPAREDVLGPVKPLARRFRAEFREP